MKYSKSVTFIDVEKENDANIDAYVEGCFFLLKKWNRLEKLLSDHSRNNDEVEKLAR